MSNEAKLSKSILEMKFMKKTKEKALQEAQEAESREIYASEITEEMKKAGNIIFRDASITICKRLIDGRMSFGGMNPDIEKLMSAEYNKQIEEIDRRKEKDIQDEEMAKQYSTVVETMGKKFQKKKNKNKFQKPMQDEDLI